MKFIVRTTEAVAGTYLVEAEDEDEAREAVGEGLPDIDWDCVEQQDYDAFEVKIDEVEESGE